MSVTSGNQAAASAAEMRRRAKYIAYQASKLAEQAGPMTRSAAMTARHSAGNAAEWATPHVARARVWMALQARRGSLSVQESVGPKVAEMLATTARKLDPPAKRARRLPKVLAGTALLAAGAAAAGAMTLRNRQQYLPPMPPRPVPDTDEPATAPAGGADSDGDRESAVGGSSGSR